MSKKKIVACLAAALVLISSVLMFSSYDKISVIAQKETEENNKYYIQSYLYNYGNINTMSYALKNRLQNQQNTPASDNILTITGSELFVQTAKEVFDDNYFWYWNSHINEDVNVHYYVKDNQSGRELTNDEALKVIDADSVEEAYQIYIQAVYDENGNVAVSSIQDMGYEETWENLFNPEAKEMIERYIMRDTEYRLYNTNELKGEEGNNRIELNSIENMSFIFAVPKTMEKEGSLYNSSISHLSSEYIRYSLIYVLGFSVVAALVFLVFPINTLKEWNWFKTVSSIKAEFLIPILLFGGCIVLSAGINLVYITKEGELFNLIEQLQLIEFNNGLTALINGFVWVLYFGIIMISMFMLRYILNKGFIRYIKENTCLFWIIGLIKKALNKVFELVDKLLSFDLSDAINKTVLKVVLANFVVICLLCSMFVYGWLFALIYSIVLFIVLKKKLVSVQADYLRLLNTANQISEGNFNVDTSEDSGLFTSLQEAFGEVKNGFEKAVNEEIKSQRMKTELISNVSHDLKTPLTSIITYVDLLKKEGVSEEDKLDYINTIDRNSQRLKNLIEDLFEISKANSGNVSLHLVEVDVVSLIHQVIFECQEKIDAAHLDFKLHFSSEHIPLLLDSLKAYRIFENLTINICKYAMNHTRVYIDVIETENQVKIVFKNISASEIVGDPAEMTERFVQGDKSRNTEGSGLGLAIVKSFTQLQNGDFNIEVDGDLFKAILIFNK